MATVAPALGGVTPAAAADATTNGSLTFITYQGDGITCPLQAQASHDTSANTAFAVGVPLGESRCFGDNVFTTVTIKYRDENNVTHTATAGGTDIVDLKVDHAKSNVRTTVTVHYSDCDANASASCDLTITANPK